MTKFAITGEAEFCICGHHYTSHTEDNVTLIITNFHVGGKVIKTVCLGPHPDVIIQPCACRKWQPYRNLQNENMLNKKIG